MQISRLLKLVLLWVITPFTYLQCSVQDAEDDILTFPIKDMGFFNIPIHVSSENREPNKTTINYDPKTATATFTLTFKNTGTKLYIFWSLAYRLSISTDEDIKAETDTHAFMIMPQETTQKTFTIHNLNKDSLKDNNKKLRLLYGYRSCSNPAIDDYYLFRIYEQCSFKRALLLIIGLLALWYRSEIGRWLGFSSKITEKK